MANILSSLTEWNIGKITFPTYNKCQMKITKDLWKKRKKIILKEFKVLVDFENSKRNAADVIFKYDDDSIRENFIFFFFCIL